MRSAGRETTLFSFERPPPPPDNQWAAAAAAATPKSDILIPGTEI